MTSLADVAALLEELFPTDTAQSWDAVGLVTGELDDQVQRIRLAVDPTQAVIDQAVTDQVDVLITHHPLLLRGVHSVAPAVSAKGAAITALIRGRLSLIVAHTNADVGHGGVSDALAAAVGLSDPSPLAIEEGQPMGRLGQLANPTSLVDFAHALAAALPAAAGGIRVSGPAQAPVRTVAVMGGAGDGFFGAARAGGADVYVTADLRHHPVLEDRETSAGGPPYIIDAGHWATESLWLTGLKSRLDQRFGALPAADRVQTDISTLRTDPWTFTIGAEPPGGTA
ncbi:MAG: Nif3-like dinuclear metal center hexameric protein [Nostocoides sp.]